MFWLSNLWVIGLLALLGMPSGCATLAPPELRTSEHDITDEVLKAN